MDSTENKSTNRKKTEKKAFKRPKKITADYLHNAGLYYLQRFSASRTQFRNVMLRKVRKSCLFHKDQDFEACASMVDETVKKFERAGLLNDELYTQGVVSSLRRAGKSKKAILMKLRIRGLPDSLVAEKLNTHDSENFPEGDKAAALMLLRKKKLGPFAAHEADEKTHEKILASLARAGFSYDTAQYVLKMSRDEAEEILNG